MNFPEHEMSDGAHRRLRRIIRDAVNAVPEFSGHAERAAEQVGRSVALDKRIRAVLSHLGSTVQDIFGSDEAVERWVAAARRSRNELAHQSHSRYDSPALGAVARGAHAVLCAVLLAELGIDSTGRRRVVRQRHHDVIVYVHEHLPATGVPQPRATTEDEDPSVRPV
ncbi:HEPN domain-containing protein [Catellatospora vulcania]|uniref:HEPN domain-containing protein n=1 Tax=Catellatospora vulcania TaxID=1460450 RepID=UPI0012D457DC|nr:HEPN domain-containing protein [Catellatospora vulcania]